MSEALADKNAAADAGGLSSGIVSIPLPRIFGRLLLLKLLARGGMGDVYLAATTGIEGAERPIVVKTVRRDHIHDGSFLARFLDEARVQSQLNHPGVAQILEASTDENGEPYTIVEYVEGRSLADVRHRAVQVGVRVGWPEAVAIAIEMGQALAHVHERAGSDGTPLGIVHRDLSPQNVMVGYAGELKLIDFGTARGHNRRCHTVAGVVFAKPGYVAPEVARQQVGDGRIDVYAMGVMLWELCAGKRLLNGDAQKHLEEVAAGKFEVPLLAETRGIPAELDAIIQKLCKNDPDDRYASAQQAAVDLARVLSLAPAVKAGERGVRTRISLLMRQLWPHEPARLRAEFAKLLKQARGLRKEPETPPSERSLQLAVALEKSADPDALPGTPYRLGKKIGEGSSGEVYEAEHTELGRKYAVKVLSSAHSSAVDAVDRFRREARAIASLSHPNLVRLHDFGKSLDGRVFLVMELLDGKTLDAYADEARLDWREAAQFGVQATLALEAAHAAGLVHRDLKPHNLFLTSSGELKLLDFGVAMALADTTTAEKRQKGFAVFGTPEYMAPEQVAGELVDARCDIYALGCVLYELVTGSRPFEGSSVVVMGKQLRETPERPRVRSAAVPLEIDAVIMKALSKSKEDRYSSAKEMREALEKALSAPAKRLGRAKRFASFSAVVALSAVGTFFFRDRLEATAQHLLEKPQPVSVTTTLAAVEPAPPPPAPPAPEPEPAPAPAPAPEVEAPKPQVAVAVAPPKEDLSDVPVPEERKPSSLLRRASAHHESAEVRTKLTEARGRAKENPSDVKALRTWAMAALSAGETREARRAAEAWAVHEPGPEPRLVLAAAFEAAHRHREARAVLEEWLTNHPDTPEARKMLQRLGGDAPAVKPRRGGATRPSGNATLEAETL
ncbi:MAG: serine/threonine protein kinase [Labilithrix sp.]|nr:serine/threonine protein kinase [Labilithrix sp.]MCW5815078.1 serine/threonine protein kinase [Labilithrix sp.]